MSCLPSARPSLTALGILFAGLLPACGAGCTSALSTAYLRDAFWETADHAAEASPAPSPTGPDAEPAAADGERRQAAIDEATSRLAKLGTLDEATRSSLVDTLHRTQQEDWPAVIDAFAASLEANPSPAVTPPPASVPLTASAPQAEAAEPHVVAKADLDQAGSTPVGIAPAAGDPPLPVAEAPTPSPPAEPAAPVPSAARSLAIQNACFASRVQGWGIVERFQADRFRPGQEVIVYFELDNLSADASAAGHTTCIDAELRLVSGDGTLVKAWSFEPIAETCRLPRHDYFARYVVTMPAAAPVGGGRLELAVTDTLSGSSAEAELPLEITAAD